MTAPAPALAYARLGWPVLPCWWLEDGQCACGAAPGDCKAAGKHPIGRLAPNGLKNATTDPVQIRTWWRREPKANLAVRTGPESNILVLDVDGEAGERALVDLDRRHGPLPELFPMQWTGGGRGGWQAFFAWPEGREIRNSAGRLGPKLDTRGTNGYVLLPPSRTSDAYRWAQDRTPWALPPEPAPEWLIDLLDPPAAPEPERAAFSPGSYRSPTGEDRYAIKALRAELALVAVAADGTRNDQLYASAHALLRLVRDGRLDRDLVDRGLIDAAQHAGLYEIEARRTIASAAKARGLR